MKKQKLARLGNIMYWISLIIIFVSCLNYKNSLNWFFVTIIGIIICYFGMRIMFKNISDKY